MTYSESARTTPPQIPRIIVVGLLVVMVAIAAALGYRLLASSSSMAALPATGASSSPSSAPTLSPSTSATSSAAIASRTRPRMPRAQSPSDVLRSENRGALGEADGVVPDGVTVFDDEYPAVAKLNPALLGALRRAATDGAKDGVEFVVDSGWRSSQYQNQLLREAVSKYGSEEEAARWVATPNMSPHVSGDAVDIWPSDAAAWLSKHGAKYGLCQIYRNELWHYELRPAAIDHSCPPIYADPTRDPRMQQ